MDKLDNKSHRDGCEHVDVAGQRDLRDTNRARTIVQRDGNRLWSRRGGRRGFASRRLHDDVRTDVFQQPLELR